MDVSLSPEFEQFVQRQVAQGKYASAADVVIAGIRLLMERECIYRGRFEELRQEVLIGVQQRDRGECLDGEEVIEQLRQKLQARKLGQP